MKNKPEKLKRIKRKKKLLKSLVLLAILSLSACSTCAPSNGVPLRNNITITPRGNGAYYAEYEEVSGHARAGRALGVMIRNMVCKKEQQ
jgi:hypothetical protein